MERKFTNNPLLRAPGAEKRSVHITRSWIFGEYKRAGNAARAEAVGESPIHHSNIRRYNSWINCKWDVADEWCVCRKRKGIHIHMEYRLRRSDAGRDKASVRYLRVAYQEWKHIKNDKRIWRDGLLHSPGEHIPVRNARMARKGDGKQRHDNDVHMAGDHDNRSYPDGKARLPFRHRHRRNNRQPLLVAAHHFHRHTAE